MGKQFEDGVQRFDGAFGAARESDEDQRPGPHRSTTLPGRIAGRERPTGRGWDGRGHRKGDFVSTHPRCPMGTRGSASAPAGLAAEEGPEKVGVSVQLPRFVCALHLPARLYGGNDLDGPAAVPKCFPESPVSMAARAERGRGRAEAGRRVRSLFDRLFSHHSAPPRSPRWRRKPAVPQSRGSAANSAITPPDPPTYLTSTVSITVSRSRRRDRSPPGYDRRDEASHRRAIIASGWSCPAMTDIFPFGQTREVNHGGEQRRYPPE